MSGFVNEGAAAITPVTGSPSTFKRGLFGEPARGTPDMKPRADTPMSQATTAPNTPMCTPAGVFMAGTFSLDGDHDDEEWAAMFSKTSSRSTLSGSHTLASEHVETSLVFSRQTSPGTR
ncbi:unnamed protein product, partial [Prorocentrum cordatum]